MLAHLIRRFGLVAAALAALMTVSLTPAWADASSEAFVKTNAERAVQQLTQPGLSLDERRERFGELMDEFADVPRIAEFVLGRYAVQLRKDPELYREWIEVFRAYALTIYAGQLDQFSGRQVEVLPGTRDSTINKKQYSIVQTQVVRDNGQPMRVAWRLIMTEGGWRVVDVALSAGDNVLWLAIQQRQDFLAALDRNGGDVRALIEDIRTQTQQMRQRMANRPT